MNRRLATAAVTIALAAIAIVLPDLINGYRLFLATLIVVFATAGVGLVIIMGWTGQIALAHVAFMGIGAYGTNWLFSDLGVPWVISLILSALAATVVGVLIGFPAARLRGFYLAIATLAFAELIVRFFVEADTITGGIAGKPIQIIQLFGLAPDRSQWYLSLLLAVVVFTATTAWAERRSVGASVWSATPRWPPDRSGSRPPATSCWRSASPGSLPRWPAACSASSSPTSRPTRSTPPSRPVPRGGVRRRGRPPVGAVIGAIFVVISRELFRTSVTGGAPGLRPVASPSPSASYPAV